MIVAPRQLMGFDAFVSHRLIVATMKAAVAKRFVALRLIDSP